MPSGLRKLDDRVLGDKGKGRTDSRPVDDDHDSHDSHDDAHDDAPREERVERTTRRRPSGPPPSSGDGLSAVLAVVWRISRLVFVALAVVLLLAVAFILLPANEDNVIVRNVLSLAETVSGPFKDVFQDDDMDRMRIYNYGLAAVVYFVVGSIVGKLPTGSKKKG